jgi:hypothetical protein
MATNPPDQPGTAPRSADYHPFVGTPVPHRAPASTQGTHSAPVDAGYARSPPTRGGPDQHPGGHLLERRATPPRALRIAASFLVGVVGVKGRRSRRDADEGGALDTHHPDQHHHAAEPAKPGPPPPDETTRTTHHLLPPRWGDDRPQTVVRAQFQGQPVSVGVGTFNTPGSTRNLRGRPLRLRADRRRRGRVADVEDSRRHIRLCGG